MPTGANRRIPKSFARCALSCLLAATAVAFAVAVRSADPPQVPHDRGAIVHALNRLGYGPRPGQIERVEAVGLSQYLETQLAPRAIEDTEAESRLAGLRSIDLTQVELMTAYPPPPLVRALARRLERQGRMDERAIERMLPELERMRELRQPRERGGDEPERRAPKLEGPARVVAELGQAKLIRAVYGERQLQEVMIDFWFNHFNVYVGKGADRWLTTSYERDAIRPHALGSFRELLGAVASHPAMLFYLDNWTSTAPGVVFERRDMRPFASRAVRDQGLPPGGVATLLLRDRGMDTSEIERRIRRAEQYAGRVPRGRDPLDDSEQPRRRGLNENYARELLELHTLGVDGGYTQQDVIEVARCFTGWTLLPLHAGQGFVYVDRLHDEDKKTVLGRSIEGKGAAEGEAVLDLLATHPSTARFVSTKLARRFVADDPPDSLVDAMAETFLSSDGDIAAVLRTMIHSPEFWSEEYRWQKVKTPFEFAVSAIRATDAELADLPGAGEPSVMSAPSRRARDRRPGVLYSLRKMGQPPYGAQPPTGYDDRAPSWVSTGALLDRMKFALGVAGNRMPGLRYEPARLIDPSLPVDRSFTELGLALLGRPPEPPTLEVLDETFDDPSGFAELGVSAAVLASAEGRTRFGVGFLLASPEFQRR